jgi:hypothetical protein
MALWSLTLTLLGGFSEMVGLSVGAVAVRRERRRVGMRVKLLLETQDDYRRATAGLDDSDPNDSKGFEKAKAQMVNTRAVRGVQLDTSYDDVGYMRTWIVHGILENARGELGLVLVLLVLGVVLTTAGGVLGAVANA